MKFRRLKIDNFGSIASTEVHFGPGLNVLYGPNDLGKSTLADAIRLVLLLPNNSSHSDPYKPWTGGSAPTIELELELAPAEIYLVRKSFAKPGSSDLKWSKNGKDWELIAKAREVDEKLRELLRWGLPDPGGKGLPGSYLATALLTTQAEVTAIFDKHLGNDDSASGKERIAAALQAVAQDPLFVSILRQTQSRRDEAFTPKGGWKSGKDSVLKLASEQVTVQRKEQEKLESARTESEHVESLLTRKRKEREELSQRHYEFTENARTARAAVEAAEKRLQAVARREQAQTEVDRIARGAAAIEALSAEVSELATGVTAAQAALEGARSQVKGAEEALREAEERQRVASTDSSGMVARQEAELRKAAALAAAAAAETRLAAGAAYRELVAAEEKARLDLVQHEELAASAGAALAEASQALAEADAEVERCELMSRGVAVVEAEAAVEAATRIVAEREALVTQREAAASVVLEELPIPSETAVAEMRRLDKELATARGALSVGLSVVVTPRIALDLSAGSDGAALASLKDPYRVEASAEIELEIGDVASVRILGGSREAQERAAALESRWAAEAVPVLQAADVTDLEGLERYLVEARAVAERRAAQARELARLDDEIARRVADLPGAQARLAELSALPHLRPDGDVEKRKASAVKTREELQRKSFELENQSSLNSERVATRCATWESARAQLQAAIEPEAGAEEALAAARAASEGADADLARMLADAQESARSMETALAASRGVVFAAQEQVTVRQAALDEARRAHSTVEGRLSQARANQALEDAPKAQATLQACHAEVAALPEVTAPTDLASLELAVQNARHDLDAVDRDILEAQGALKQVGGNIAEERLAEVTEALQMAEVREKTVQADYEAWKLLLEQLKEADAAQASNLGQALAPVIAERFASVTQERYQGIRLDAQLGAPAILVGTTARDIGRVSVGTREQLSTLYRLCLAEYLRSALVLDDQLVQSDSLRMDWFRALLTEKARDIQIVVMTCRPADYAPDHACSEGEHHRDSEDGFVRAIDLHRAIQRS